MIFIYSSYCFVVAGLVLGEVGVVAGVVAESDVGELVVSEDGALVAGHEDELFFL